MDCDKCNGKRKKTANLIIHNKDIEEWKCKSCGDVLRKPAKIYNFTTTLTAMAHGWKREALKDKGTFIEYKLDDDEGGHWNTRVGNAKKALERHGTIPAVFLVGQTPHRYILWKITETVLFLVPERERKFLIDMAKSKGLPPLSSYHRVYEIYCTDTKGVHGD